MCGIFCINSTKKVIERVIQGLQFLEYRGYDSSGIASINKNKFTIIKSLGQVSNLSKKINNIENDANIAIGHTRWATHGKVNLINTHPISYNNISVVHNGIIENYQAIKTKLVKLNYKFHSDTDTEVIIHLIQYYIDLKFDYLNAFQQTIKNIKGNYAIATIFSNDENYIFCAKNGSPLLIGCCSNSYYVSSDVDALGFFANKVMYLKDGETAIIGKNSLRVTGSNDLQLMSRFNSIAKRDFKNNLQGFPNFMLKEINEQPKILKKIINGMSINQNNSHISNIRWSNIKKISIVSCGSSYNAGFLGKYWFENYARIPVDIEFASEFSSRNIIYDQDVIYIFISQSGETLDTLTALKKTIQNKVTTIGIINNLNSAMSHLVDYVILTEAGSEFSVAATKTFTAQLMQLLNLALIVSMERNLISKSIYKQLLKNITNNLIDFSNLLNIDSHILKITTLISNSNNIFFIGRNDMYPICLEGALKLKELSYLPVFASSAGELKHGSIALINVKSLVIALAPQNKMYYKMLANIEEVKARGARVIVLTDSKENLDVEYLLNIPKCSEIFTPLLYTIPIQLFAYQVAFSLGNNVDRPRNLAKSVTVE